MFEDLPSFLVMLVALGVFISSVFYSSTLWFRAWEKDEKYEACAELVEALEGYDGLLASGYSSGMPIEGLFSAEKLDAVDVQALKEDIGARYNFSVGIEDLGGGSLAWEFGDPLPQDRTEKVVLHSTVAVQLGPDEVHTARLKVTLW